MKSIAVMGSASVTVTVSSKSARPSPLTSPWTSQVEPAVFTARSSPAVLEKALPPTKVNASFEPVLEERAS